MFRPALASICLLALASCGESPAAQDSEPQPTTTLADQGPPPPSPENDVRHFLLQEYPEAAPMRYALAWSDLDDDGVEEAIVYLAGMYFCGSGGCNTLVLTPAGPMWRKVGEISVSRTPITVLESSTNGWKDLTVAVAGGGGEAGTALLRFDGRAYPSNPTVAPAEMTGETGTVLIAGEPGFTDLEAMEGSGG